MKAAALTILFLMAPTLVSAQSAYRSSYSHSAYSGSAYSQPRTSLNNSSYSQPVHVNGYVRTDGSYVQPHYRSEPNDTRTDNYSTSGNVNPYTGQQGYRDPYGY